MSTSEISSKNDATQKETQLKDQRSQRNEPRSKRKFFNYRFWIGGFVLGILIFLILQSIFYHKDVKTISVPDQQMKSKQAQNLSSALSPLIQSNLTSSVTRSEIASDSLNRKEEEGNRAIPEADKESLKAFTPSHDEPNDNLSENKDNPQPNTQDLENKIKNLEQKLVFLEKQKQQKSLLWFSFQNLRKALEGSQNFEQELQQYRKVTLQNVTIQENLDFLMSYAKSGLPTAEYLVHRFKIVKDQLTEILEQRLTGWHKVRLYLMPWIQIYKIQNDEMLLSPDLIQKLQKSVDLKDFDQVLEILSWVKEEMPPILKEWQQQVLMYQQKSGKIKTLSDQTIFEVMHLADPIDESRI